MNCPSCNQTAVSFLRSFSLQGVSLYQSMKGYFKCQHCGVLLRIKSFGRHFWYFFVGSIIVLALFILLYRRLMIFAGVNAMVVIWLVILLGIMFTFIFITWKYAQPEKVETDPTAKTN
jgi:amino acid transporter